MRDTCIRIIAGVNNISLIPMMSRAYRSKPEIRSVIIALFMISSTDT